ncbi:MULTISPECIES: cation diffusion facilitator family transporter [unclassified Spirosoma]|jgi:cobalt-zinc-cadmium efflux system protein|uniref:cation diffusion facilitator family transporter n=1 Tax=unclassified Spirosoma TaxID=2621999 RepID=UPI00095F61CD|nr:MULTISPECIES: cation diffusion facilitator family transporter [unclassified Spirosoma]MBN8826902.1 cation transporter [Spirosoma sp.]OJW72929.1 MAG: cation transporter [Spirosoma sp. 48-14]
MLAQNDPNQGSAASRYNKNLRLVFALTFTYFLVEVVAGYWTRSLALLSDAAHMLTDVIGLGLALFATWMSRRPITARRSFGFYRLEILSAFLNALVLIGISFYILYEAYQRFQNPPTVESSSMTLVALIGLLVNLYGLFLLRQGSKESLNVKGAFLEVVSDLLSSVGVIIAGLVMTFTGWYYADPLFSAVIGLFILPRTLKLMMESVNILLQASPDDINLIEVQEVINSIPGFGNAHDIHVWTLTSGIIVMSGHVVVGDALTNELLTERITEAARQLEKRFAIGHIALQPERQNQCTNTLTTL